MQTTIENNTGAAPLADELQSLDALCDDLSIATSDRVAWKAAAEWLATYFQADFLIVELDSRSGSSTIVPSNAANDEWQPLCDALLLKSRQDCQIVTRASSEAAHAVAVPMRAGNSSAAEGGVAMALQRSPDALQLVVSEFMAFVRVCESAIRTRRTVASSQSNSAMVAQQGISQAGSYRSLHQYAFAITNGLQAKLNCDEVTIGVLRKERVRILSISGMDSLHPRTPGSKAIQQALEEAADTGSTTVSPRNHSENVLTDMPLADQWCRDAVASSVACIPLKHAGSVVAVIGLKRTDETDFSEEELQQAEKLVTPLASGLVLLDQANQSLTSHAAKKLATLSSKWTQLNRRTRGVIMVVAMSLIGWLGCGSTQYTLQVPCEIIAGEPVQIAAPFEGRIRKAHVRPGERFRAGQTLVEFETTRLFTEQRRLEAELRIAEIGTLDALNAHDIGAAGRARNQAQAAGMNLARVRQQIQDATIVAEFDGYVLDGDLQPRVGESLAVGTELMQIARADGLAVEARVSENDATYVSMGQPGEFSTNARPGQAWMCEVQQVDAAASIVDGENVFVARAKPTGTTATWLRPGMQGVAKINAGQKPAWWVYLHRMTDWVRMQAWKL